MSEQELHWRQFLASLVERGLSGVELVISDAHSGLQAARKAVLGGVPWQGCQFHLQQNAQAFVPRQELKSEVAADIRAIFTAPSRACADSLLAQTVQEFPVSPGYLRSLLRQLSLKTGTSDDKAARLEQIAYYLMSLLPGCVPKHGVLDIEHAHQSDLVARNLYRGCINEISHVVALPNLRSINRIEAR